jgi:Protein of unknown function (DUF3455)
MCARKLRIYVLILVCFGTPFSAHATEFQGIPLPENTSVVLAVASEGVQIYESKPGSTGAYEWVLEAPEAELKNLSGEVLGKHFGGPTWSLNDGSQLVGNLPPLKIVNDPDGRNIAWLLVAVKSKTESGILSKIDYIMRIATSGGVPPSGDAEKSYRYGPGEL